MTDHQEIVEALAIKAKSGDKEALKVLVIEFSPLIYKTSNTIYVRYGKLFPLPSIINQAKYCLMQLTMMKYDQTKAHYPYFIQKYLHAELVKLYRPQYAYMLRTTTLEEAKIALPFTLEQLYQDDRVDICNKLMEFVNKNCNEREKELIEKCICGHTPRNQLAIKYHISFQRMKNIYKRLMEKLKEQAIKCGIRRKQDI